MKYGKLCFVDLAGIFLSFEHFLKEIERPYSAYFGFSRPGNERVKETKSSGELFTESQNINKSLLTLGKRVNYKILLIQIVAVGQIYNLLYR